MTSKNVDIDQTQYQLILSQGHIPKDRLDLAFSHPNRRIYNDFVEFLLHSLMLRADIALNIRQQVNQSLQKSLTPAAPMRASIMTVAELENAYQQALATSPLFSPHAREQFKLIEKLGEGGMGVVHRIKDENLGRSGALKVLGAVDASERSIARFIREARITASLSHPNIPPVYELGMNSSGEHYMLMKVIEGQSLREAISELHSEDQAEPKEIRSLLEALVKVCEAMAYAHSKGVIHRDLKPENIMIGEFGEVMVLDWGLARNFSDEDKEDFVAADSKALLELKEAAQKEGLTGAGDLLGTVGYMAPEQVDGEATKQSDVFALGAILTEILTGKKAIAGDSVISKLSATIQGRISGPRQLDDRSSRELNALALKSLEIRLEDRLGEVQLFVRDLRAFLLGEELKSYRYNWFERSQRWLSARPTLLSSGLIVGMMLVSSLYFQSVLAKSETRRVESEAVTDRALDNKERIERGLALFEKAAEAASRRTFSSDDIAAVEEALSLGGRTRNDLLRAASIYKLGQRRDLSRDVLVEATRRFAPDYEALYQLHLLGSGTEDLREGSEYLERILALSRERREENRFVAIARLSEAIRGAKWSDVLKLSELCGEDFPSNGSFYFYRGKANFALKRYRAALNEYLHALKLKPNSARFALHAGYAHEGVHERMYARLKYDLAISLDAVCVEAWLARAKIRRNNRNFICSTIDLQEAVRLDPTNELANEWFVLDLAALGKKNEAMREANEALKRLPNSVNLYRVRASLSLARGDVKGALKDFEKAYLLNPESNTSLLNLGGGYFATGNLAKAEETYRKLILRDAKNKQGIFMLGRVRFETGARKEGLELVNKAISLDPKVEYFYFIRGYYYTKLKKDKEAVRDFSEALSLNVGLQRVYHFRGLAYERLGMNKKAALDYEQFLKSDPKNKAGSKKRAFIERHLGRPSKY